MESLIKLLVVRLTCDLTPRSCDATATCERDLRFVHLRKIQLIVKVVFSLSFYLALSCVAWCNIHNMLYMLLIHT